MGLSIQDWGAIGEIIGGIAVVATLIYLSIQLKQTSQAVKVSTADTGSTHNAAVWREMIANPELVKILIKGGKDVLSLSEEDYFRYILANNMIMRFFEHQFLLKQQGALPDGFWEGIEVSIAEILGTEGAKYAWQQNNHLYSAEFKTLVAGLNPPSQSILDKPPNE